MAIDATSDLYTADTVDIRAIRIQAASRGTRMDMDIYIYIYIRDKGQREHRGPWKITWNNNNRPLRFIFNDSACIIDAPHIGEMAETRPSAA